MVSKRPFGLGGLPARCRGRGAQSTLSRSCCRSSARVIRTRRGAARYKGPERESRGTVDELCLLLLSPRGVRVGEMWSGVNILKWVSWKAETERQRLFSDDHQLDTPPNDSQKK